MTSTTLRDMLVKQEPRNVSYCYVCAGPRAEYTIFSKPYGDHPFFPFLEHHQPPDGAESMRPDGRVLTCFVCYTFLTQQWDQYERTKTPQNKRIYWLKRLDGGPFAGMDVNLQQDYESLFETSNASMDAESRPRQKYSRSPYLTTVEMKPKLNERPEQAYPSTFGFANRSVEKTDLPPTATATNILDLSLPARTPSRTSNSSSPAIYTDVCYMCGHESKTVVSVYAIPIPNCPYFPSIISHQKPANAKPMDSSGRVFACECCFKIMIQQWEYYERKKVPQNERVYQIKTASNVPKAEEESKKSFVCYTCGMVAQLSVQRFIYAYPEKSGDPCFSFLLNLNPHPGANKLVNGKASVCSLCFKTLSRQLRVFELSNTPEEKRKYKILNETITENFSVLREHLKSSGQSQDGEVKYCCYLCECSTDLLVSVNTLPMSEVHFPFIRGMPKPPNACPIDNDGRVKVCKPCHDSLVYQFDLFERTHIPIQQRQYKVNSKLSNENHFHENSVLPANASKLSLAAAEINSDLSLRKSDMCSLCERPISNETPCYIETVPQENNMYFPSIAVLVKPNTKPMDEYGRVFACNQCRLILKNQWEVFESARVPHSQRQYEIFPPKPEPERPVNFNSEMHLPNSSSALHIQVSSPDIKLDLTKHPNIEPLLTTVNTLSVTTITSTNASASNSPLTTDIKPPKFHSSIDEPVPRISGPLDVPTTRPLLLAPIHCFVCGELNVSGLTYTIKALPTTPVGVDKPPEEVPFFPFLTKHTPPDNEKLRNDGSALVCMFCYYSLISQWLAYESSPYPEDNNRWHRHYNFHNYVCYICGITTYRKRVCTISVKDFPFLLEHSRPPGALTVLNGECVITCQTCFESITSQWKDFERMKVPVEMRKYNWIVVAPPADDENSRGCQILAQENSASNLSQAENDPMLTDDLSIPSGLKPPPSHLAVPSVYNLTKPVGRNVISPVHQSSVHSNSVFSPYGNNVNQAINATRTSSFAAALRKLAKAVDPVAEKEITPISPASSPTSSQQSQSSHSRHHASLPIYLNSHSSNPSGHRASPPVVSVPPMQNSQGKALDLGRYSNSSRNGNLSEPVSLKIENSKLSSSDKRSDSGGTKLLSSSQDQLSLRHEHNVPSRGFQPYRNSEERRSTPPQVYNPSPPPTTMGGYHPYHPSFAQSSQLPHQTYRLEESVYMERYGLLRPGMPYPPSSNILSHPRAPLYPTSHYPPELIPQTMRPPPSSSSAYPSRYREEEIMERENNLAKKHEMEAAYREHERYMERKEEREREYRDREVEYLRKERQLRQSPVHHPHPSSRAELSAEEKGHMGSITHGTPRDYVRRMSPTPPVSVPLNLATNMMNAENELAMEEEMNAKMMKYRNKAVINGQVHHRNSSHPSGMSYRKESDTGSYKVNYQINSESHSKPSVTMTESAVISNPSKPMPSYYMERDRDYQKQEHVETRTLSMASVINSQINGIFAREKFVSNNSYDYFNSFCDKNSDSSQKHKTESKSALSAHDYMPHSKASSSKVTPPESSKHDVPDNKLPPFLLSNSSVPSARSNNYPPLLKAREPSITRALLQNPVATSYESEVRVFEEPLPKVKSVLDRREDRLRKLRQAGEILDSDYSDPDSDEEDLEKLNNLLRVTKGPQTKIELEPKKTKFLSQFRLVTHYKKETIELKKCLRRHQLLREKSVSPVTEEPPKSTDIEYDSKHLSELSKRLCLEEDFEAKTEFFKLLGLLYVPPEEKEEKERVTKVVESERLRRNGIIGPSQRCLELQGSHLGKRASDTEIKTGETDAKKPNIITNSSDIVKQEEPLPSSKPLVKKIPVVPLKPFKSPANSITRMSAFLKPPFRSANLPIPPLIPAIQVIPSVTEPVRDATSTVVASKDPRVRQLHEFAQEFHNSVLQTTQMQLEKKNLPPSVHMETSFLKSPSKSSTLEKPELFLDENRASFRWPGIEAIMESYECHISEQSTERTFLVTNCQKLKTHIQESNAEIECLGRKTEELVHHQKILESEKRELQNKIEAFRLFIQRFR